MRLTVSCPKCNGNVSIDISTIQMSGECLSCKTVYSAYINVDQRVKLVEVPKTLGVSVSDSTTMDDIMK